MKIVLETYAVSMIKIFSIIIIENSFDIREMGDNVSTFSTHIHLPIVFAI